MVNENFSYNKQPMDFLHLGLMEIFKTTTMILNILILFHLSIKPRNYLHQ